ncbi:MAG: lipoyl(octanoyl) transferase LipB [Candidatus Marinimicrobia bacterium]|jgi:lipoate-protein ligase B|nr:lipoyl(octanoyl) transferase LipB [Candidatus Neomarinimicrobiota bacterium]MDP6614496.1 lipoyl(octanoyl) transferase LipB [Candidatus Neomarinimicrobiota bacterium]MDP6820833.1 lipoyl(octanoyl) transferase LipB [Candidatus Neomarinimicrobiota bacterium]MDP6861207.1 lipoyl(octanoyl) transferase LipB [Candidatus Neomarinimicrobiota bacterium]HJM33496.1 lipoyl(octanoyl) transferase LipB [Candidatus Neomarinimicrobiota bacterium]|tara:strand:+ start:335 stop:982 length:648 start_codon:yes stop_codon:yes gene_type:complete
MIETQLDQIIIQDLGQRPYQEVWAYQKKIQSKRIAGEIEDTLLMVEHEPVYTLGKNANENHLLQSRDQSVDVFNIERGGDITFHGPGQLVGYPILDLSHYKKSISWYMRTLEQIIIDTVSEFGIEAKRIKGLTGVWVGDEKIAALGVRIRRWVTMHGFSINVNTDLTFYDGIIPCGIFDHGITSMEQLLCRPQDMEKVKKVVRSKFRYYFKLGES